MDALVGLGDDDLDAQQRRALGRPVARRAGSVLLARQDDERHTGLGVGLGGLEDRRDLTVTQQVAGEAALRARRQLVAQPDVGEGPADHDLVVAAARAVGVEVTRVHAVLGQVAAGGAVLLDRSGRGDVVRRDRVAELQQHASAGDVGDGLGLQAHAVEVRRLAHVGGVLVPLEDVALGGREVLPPLVAGEDVGVLGAERLGVDRGGDDPLDLARRRPDVTHVDVVAVGVLTQRVLEEVDVHGPGQGVGDDQRGRGEVVHLDVGVDAPLEVPVAREHRRHGEVALVDRGADLGDERTGVADARRAAVAHEVEAELLQVGRQAGLRVVVGDDLGARREGGLDPGLARQALLDGILGEQGGTDHHRRVGGVRARRDGRDRDRAVVDLELRAVLEPHVLRVRGTATVGGRAAEVVPRGRLAVGVGVRRRVGGGEALLERLVPLPAHGVGVLADVRRQGTAEAGLGVGERDAVLRTLGTGDRRHDGGEVELEVLGVARLGLGVVPQALRLGVGLDERDLLGAAAGQLHVGGGLLVDREDRDGGAVLGAHVADRGAVGQRHRPHAGAVELDELADDAVLAQHLGDREHEVGGGGALGQLAGELEADDARDQHADRLAQHGRLGLDAADAPAHDAEAVDHRRVGVGADAGVGVGDGGAVGVLGEDDAGQVLDVDLVHDAGARGDDLEVVERALAPAQELVALAVALVLDLDVALEGVGGAEDVGDDGVVDDHLGRCEGVDPARVPAEVGHGLAHRGEVDDARHAGEVLHDHAGGRELDLLAGVGRGVPAGEGLDVGLGDVGPVLGAQQRLEEDLQAERQGGDVEAVARHLVEAVDLVGVVTHLQ